MKKNFLQTTVVCLMVLVGMAASAQTTLSRDDMRRIKMQTINKRDASLKYQQSSLPQLPATQMGAVKSTKGVLPEGNVWFPGEWEEVKAIVVTCYYDYLVPGHENDYQWYADPVVSGVAEYIKYSTSGNYSSQGYGPYTAVLDSSSAFGKIFFYIMDAIQLGGAEAWVRVEAAEDSNIVLRTLERMNLRHDNVRFLVGTGNSFWYRDCGPICFYYGNDDNVGMLDFGYYPGRALDDSLPAIINQTMNIPNFITSIEWEGGNCLVDGTGMVLSSDAIYGNNTDTYGQITWDGVNQSSIGYTTKQALTSAQVRDSLHQLIGPRATYVLPAFRYDGGTGHIDLYVDMWDENGFVFSKFPDDYSTWVDYNTAAKNIDSLTSYQSVFGENYRETYIPFPCTNTGGTFASQTSYNSNYTRTYSNHTFVNNVIIQPVFSTVVNGQPSQAWDRERFDSIKKAYPGYTLYPIDVRQFDGSGGAIHCVTKQIPADNPIRILHQSITGCQNSAAGTDIPVSATITNKSGIAHSECVYRINGGEWQTLNLTATGSNVYGSQFPTAGINVPTDGSGILVEYYISATSNNGKTITKPMTAMNGGYYNFYFGSYVSGIDDVKNADKNFGQFYPNPSNSVAHININLENGANYKVTILDITGRAVHESTLQADGSIVYTVNTSKLAHGTYSVVFSNGASVVARKLVVQ